ncbi:hypothetical protein [Desulfobacter latus]|uniref:hypothetical protein n=1 Tax=Desulfobacter latus TaxID=2292 RepID=UPI001FE829CD|nr:hypothetical protein [Desulfobacter latus]
MAQAIVANDTVWAWGNDIKTLYQIPISDKEGSDARIKIKECSYFGTETPEYSNSPAFDGVGIGFLHERKFNRVSAFDGNLMGEQLENTEFGHTTQCAPLVAEFKNDQNPFRPYRYWITCLKDYLLVVDVRFINEEDYHLIPLNLEIDDAPRSPVIIDDTVFVVTQKGWILGFNIHGEFKTEIRQLKEPEILKQIDGFNCLAPMVVNGYIVFETIAEKTQTTAESQYGDFREIGYMSYHPLTQASFYYPSGGYVKNSYLDSMGHLPGFSDGNFAYFPSRSRDEYHYNKFTPGQSPQPKRLSWNEPRIPTISSLNSVMMDTSLIVVDPNKKRIIKWNLDQNHSPEINPIPLKGRTTKKSITLVSQPVIHGDILILVFDDQIVRMSI